MKLTPKQKALRRRILEITYRRGLSHLGSNLSAVDIIEALYRHKKKSERCVLSNGHAGVALYVVLERHGLLASGALEDLPIHPDRDPASGIDVSTGSLGHGVPIALGMALADRRKNVYCVSSDGECAEGSVWEALRVAVQEKARNLTVVINANGWSAYEKVSLPLLIKRLAGFSVAPAGVNGHDLAALAAALKARAAAGPAVIFARTTVEQFPFLKGQDAHYYTMTETDYRRATEILA